jgi:hypothetical protein
MSGAGVRDGVADGNTKFVLVDNGTTDGVDCPAGMLQATTSRSNVNINPRDSCFEFFMVEISSQKANQVVES